MRKIESVLGVVAAASIGIQPALANEFNPDVYRVAPGETVKIDRHGVCRRVSNSGGSDLSVPVQNAAEWANGESSFLGRTILTPLLTLLPCVDPWVGTVAYSFCASLYSERIVNYGFGPIATGTPRLDRNRYIGCAAKDMQHTYSGNMFQEYRTITNRPISATYTNPALLGHPNLEYREQISGLGASCSVGFAPHVERGSVSLMTKGPLQGPIRKFEEAMVSGHMTAYNPTPSNAEMISTMADWYEIDQSYANVNKVPASLSAMYKSDWKTYAPKMTGANYFMAPPPQGVASPAGVSRASAWVNGTTDEEIYVDTACIDDARAANLPPNMGVKRATIARYFEWHHFDPFVIPASITTDLSVHSVIDSRGMFGQYDDNPQSQGHLPNGLPLASKYPWVLAQMRINGGPWIPLSGKITEERAVVTGGDTIEVIGRLPAPSSQAKLADAIAPIGLNGNPDPPHIRRYQHLPLFIGFTDKNSDDGIMTAAQFVLKMNCPLYNCSDSRVLHNFINMSQVNALNGW